MCIDVSFALRHLAIPWLAKPVEDGLNGRSYSLSFNLLSEIIFLCLLMFQQTDRRSIILFRGLNYRIEEKIEEV